MPTYEYVCTSCGKTWEEIQKITEPAIEACPSCQKLTAKRQISGGNFILKGGGWYADLYSSSKGSKGGASEDSSSKAGEGGGGSGGTGKSDAKTEKSETKSEDGGSSSSGDGGATSGSSKTAAE